MSFKEKMSKTYGDYFGAFADAAILIPLIFLLSQKPGFNGSALWMSAGVAYFISGLFFRIPMSVQPLKSIAIAGIALSATASEIKIAGALLGLACLTIGLTMGLSFKGKSISAWTEQIPPSIIQGVQFGLGVLLVFQGMKQGFGWVSSIVAIALVILSVRSSVFPWLGFAAVAVVGVGIWNLRNGSGFVAPVFDGTPNGFEPWRVSLVFALVLPQIALTFSNSVLGTMVASKKYFGERSSRVTPKNLLLSIGIGNLLMPLWPMGGGLPFCHGAGGVTAHARGGSKTYISNVVIALFCLAMALTGTRLSLPASGLSMLLICTGVLHMGLASALFKKPFALTLIFICVSLTQNLLWVLGLAISIELWRKRYDYLPASRRDAQEMGTA